MSDTRYGPAAIGDGAGGFVIDEVAVRAPQAGEVRVALQAAGLCHTDHASLRWPGPLVLGHEGAGVVDSVGEGVIHFEPGQRVLLNWAVPCGRCPQCQRGRGRGADHAFEATGVAALAFLPLKLCRNGGHAVQLSGAHGPVTVEMPEFWWDKRYLVPLYGGCQPERDFPRLFDWALRGELQLDRLVTHTYALADLGRALDDMLAGRSAKGVILFD